MMTTCTDHTPHPTDYNAHVEWVEEMRIHFLQVKCDECHRWKIWVPK